MFLKDKSSGYMLEVLNVTELFDPFVFEIEGCYQHGEEVQAPENFKKTSLVFLSGESLPTCWIDVHYREGLRRVA